MTLELVVAFLQAFVFAALTCVYLNEVVNLDHATEHQPNQGIVSTWTLQPPNTSARALP